jgi:hypothetical protein
MYPRVMPGLVGSDLRADRERASRTSRTGSPRRCNRCRDGIGTKGRKDHQEMMIINRKRASRQSRVGLPENRSLIPLRSLRSYVCFGFWAKSKRLSTGRWEPRKYATANVFMQHPKKARLSWLLVLNAGVLHARDSKRVVKIAPIFSGLQTSKRVPKSNHQCGQHPEQGRHNGEIL